jgi:hypothetical protein
MKSWMIWGSVLLVWLIGGFYLGGMSYFFELPAAVLVLFGWMRFLVDNVPRMTFDPPAVAIGLAAMVLFVVLAHFTLRSFSAGRAAATEPAATPRTAKWKWRWTLAILAVVLLMFVAGTAMVGLAHQAVWLATSPEPVYEEVLGGYHGRTDPQTYGNRLKMMGLGIDGYRDTNRDSVPEAADSPTAGLHSWETGIAPYMNYVLGMIDRSKPWDDAVNAAVFRKPFPDFLNPNYTTDTWQSADGFGLSHFAANEQVVGTDGVSKFAQITDGTSNTMLIGEVDANFEPWGKPGNWRDPALGLNRSPQGFGCPRAGRMVYFVMADGSVRHFREDVDPEVLRALATPAAGDEATLSADLP